jgi:hypothetical protein
LYCILPNEYRIVPARSSTAAGFLRRPRYSLACLYLKDRFENRNYVD